MNFPGFGCFGRAILVLLLAAFSLASRAAESAAPPNIIFIMADDLGYGHLGSYGQKKIKTPNLDRLAAEGMRFTQFYSGSHVCAPSRSVLMTGLHSGHTPIRANGGGRALADSDITIAEVLKRGGYATGGFGKWGLGIEGTSGHPNFQGFDRFFGYYHQVHAHFYYPYFLWENTNRFRLSENEGKKQKWYAHDVIHQQAVQFLKTHARERFFLYLPYTLPHVELTVPEDSEAPYRGLWPESPLPDPRPGYLSSEHPRAAYAGMVSRLDRDVGQILDLLKTLGIDSQTIVFFTSDNGPQGDRWAELSDFFDGNGPLRGYKGGFYEGGIRVPLLARWPGRIKPGTVNDHPCASWDVLPTLTELAQTSPPEQIDGISFAPVLLGKPAKIHDFFYWEYRQGNQLTQAVRMGEWKAIFRPRGTVELYNLKEDLGETANLAGQHPEILQKIRDYLATARTEERQFPVEEPRVGIQDYVR